MPGRPPDPALGSDFQFISYTFRELASGTRCRRAGATIPTTPRPSAAVRRGRGASQAGGARVDRRFRHDALLLEDKEVDYLKRDVEREYAQDLRRNVLAMLFDLLELQTYGRCGPS